MADKSHSPYIAFSNSALIELSHDMVVLLIIDEIMLAADIGYHLLTLADV